MDKPFVSAYSFGHMVVDGSPYTSDLKIIKRKVVAGWWRRSGHRIAIEDITDMLAAQPQCLVFGTGKPGLMKTETALRKQLEKLGIELIEEPTARAVHIVNELMETNRSFAAGFHLTC